MSIFKYFRDILNRNRKRVFIGISLAIGSYILTDFIQRKVNEFQNRLKEENSTRELIKKRFHQTQKDCFMTFQSFLPMLMAPINNSLNIDEITLNLRKSKSIKSSSSDIGESNRSKHDLWNDLKLMSITKMFTVVYCQSILIILIHLQLNIISRKSYMRTALKVASRSQGIELIDAEENAEEVNEEGEIPEQAFLSLTWWILNKGWPIVKSIVENNVNSVFNEVNLRDELTMDGFSDLLCKVQNGINLELFKKSEYDNQINLIKVVLPSNSQELDLLLESSNSLNFLRTFNSNQSNIESFDKLENELEGYFQETENLTNTISSIGVSQVLFSTHKTITEKLGEENSVKFALIVTTISSKLGELETSGELHNQLNSVDLLDDLCASVYSNFTN